MTGNLLQHNFKNVKNNFTSSYLFVEVLHVGWLLFPDWEASELATIQKIHRDIKIQNLDVVCFVCASSNSRRRSTLLNVSEIVSIDFSLDLGVEKMSQKYFRIFLESLSKQIVSTPTHTLPQTQTQTDVSKLCF